MASLRDSIAEAFVSVFDEIDGVTCWRRDEVTSLQFDGILVVVNILGESKQPQMDLFYDCTLRIGATIIVNREDSDPVLDGSNETRYLERAMTMLEKVVHTVELVQDSRPVIVGSSYGVPTESNQIGGNLELSVQYAHDWNNPDTYNPNYA